jgi:hypothetical protein
MTTRAFAECPLANLAVAAAIVAGCIATGLVLAGVL